MSYYVIQYKRHHWETKWETGPHKFPTLEEAKAYFNRLPIKADHRIAESYTVTRYKPVKEAYT